MRQLLLPYKFKTRLKNLKRARLQIASFRDIYFLVLLVVRVECCKRDSTKTTFGNNSRRLHLNRQDCSPGGEVWVVGSIKGAKCAS